MLNPNCTQKHVLYKLFMVIIASSTINTFLSAHYIFTELCNGILVTLIENDSYAGEILESIAVCLDETWYVSLDRVRIQ